MLFVSFSSAYSVEFFHSDHLGSPSVVTSGSGGEVWSADYEIFGETLNEVGSNKVNYNSKEQDDTGLLYYGARYYNSETGRFITADTVKGNSLDILSQNRYSYVKNNPLKYTDPTGNKFEKGIDNKLLDGTWSYEKSLSEENYAYLLENVRKSSFYSYFKSQDYTVYPSIGNTGGHYGLSVNADGGALVGYGNYRATIIFDKKIFNIPSQDFEKTRGITKDEAIKVVSTHELVHTYFGKKYGSNRFEPRSSIFDSIYEGKGIGHHNEEAVAHAISLIELQHDGAQDSEFYSMALNKLEDYVSKESFSKVKEAGFSEDSLWRMISDRVDYDDFGFLKRNLK